MTSPGVLRIAAYAWSTREDQLLLTKVAPGNLGAGMWTLPGGGVDFGEEPADALHRELYEETGLRGTITGIIGVDSVLLPADRRPGTPALHWIRLIYAVAASGTPTVVEVGGSTDEAAWHRLDDLPGHVDLVAAALTLAGHDA